MIRLIRYFIIYTIIIGVTSILAAERCEKEIVNAILIKDSIETKDLIIWYPTKVGSSSIYDKCSYTTGEPLQRNCTEIEGKAKWFEINSDNKYVECNDIERYCKEEIFEHNFRNNDEKLEKYKNKWQKTEMGKVGYLEKECYVNADNLLTRKCIYNPSEYKAEWRKSPEEMTNMICWKEQNLVYSKRQCKNDFLKTTLHNGQTEENVLLIWFPTNAGFYSEQPLCNSINGLPLKRHCMFNRTRNIGIWESINKNMKFVNCSAINKECSEEEFIHNYIKNNNHIISHKNHWKRVEMHEVADLQEPCLNSDGLPVTRRCNFNSSQLKAEWEPLSSALKNISCLLETQEKVVTYEINKLYEDSLKAEVNGNIEPANILENLNELLTTSQNVRIPADIKISSEILKLTTEDNTSPELLKQVLNFTDIVTNSNLRILLKSEELNATSNLLNTIDNYLHNMAKTLIPPEKCSNITDGIFYETVNRTSVFYINPTCSNISGVAIYKTKETELQKHHHCYQRHHRYDSHTRTCYRFLYLNQSVDQLTNESGLRIATYIPLTLWHKLNYGIGSVNDKTALMFVIFPNDLLFVNRTEIDYKPLRNILEIHITDYSGK